ncbi:MAG TPA: nucleoside-diphosphate sugar epimerase/dehydratase [Stellaceae bacterium]|jgi:O-antigen biosynthesis protein WbqV|nr:nucleoside-diphosphate sugar epimerase/dehydratase [Stellaceae bacterium]
MVTIFPNNRRAFLAFLHDVTIAAVSIVASLYLRLGNGILDYEPRLTAVYIAGFTLIAAGVFLLTGLYRGIWRFASLPDLFNITRAVSLTVLVFLPVMFVLTRLETFPRSILLIDWFVLIALLGGPRLAYRLFKDRGLDHILERVKHQSVPVLLISAKDGADTFIREMRRDPRAVYRVVGVLADTPSRVGREIYRVPILGTIDALDTVVEQLDRRGKRPQKLIITAQNLPGEQIRRLLDRADALAIPLARLPRLTDFERNLDNPERALEPIALEDLLGRSQAVLDRDGMARLIRGHRILVTGAGGTIGAELARQIAALSPGRLILLDNGEFALYGIEMELRERFPGLRPVPLLRDVRDRTQVDEVIAAEKPEIIFHAAALKHLPMVEANPIEGVLTNVVGSRNVAEAARAYGTSLVVMISTDKAVNPASVMGATKRLAESFCQALDLYEARRRAPLSHGTRYVTVRFGNVLGSTGSVVPLFQRQLAAGGPLTVTDPEVTRFFMTVREAVELVLQASALSPESEATDTRGKIFVLDMGEPVKIVDLAHQMIRLAGLRAGRDVGIEFIGLRPGEKLHEELFHPAEPLIPTGNPAIRLAAPRTADYPMLARSIDELEENARARRDERLLQLLGRLVPEYRRTTSGPSTAAASGG